MCPAVDVILFTFTSALFMIGPQSTATLKCRDQGFGAASFFEIFLGELNVLVTMDIGHEILITILSLVIGNFDLVRLEPSRHVFAELHRTFREFHVQGAFHLTRKQCLLLPSILNHCPTTGLRKRQSLNIPLRNGSWRHS